MLRCAAAYALVMDSRVMFCDVVSLGRSGAGWRRVSRPWMEPVKAHVHSLGVFGLDFVLITPSAVLLSVWIDVGGCGCPISFLEDEMKCSRSVVDGALLGDAVEGSGSSFCR